MQSILKYFLILIPFFCNAQFYNGSQVDFGKNRVQYFEFDWRSHNYERFKIYFYRGEDEFAVKTAKQIQKELYAIEDLLNFSLNEHLEIVLFKSLQEMRQSNLGLQQSEIDAFGGKAQLVKNKLFLYFPSNQIDFNSQIRYVLAQTIIHKILLGEQWSDVLVSEDASRHPAWFVLGLSSYFAENWSAKIESEIKSGILSKRFADFSKLSTEEAKIAGHAFWYFIDQTYGRNQVLSLLYLSKIAGHIDRSLLYLLGSNSEQLSTSFISFYNRRFLEDSQYMNLEPLSKPIGKGAVTANISAQKGSSRAWVEERLGKYTVYLSIDNKRAKKIKAYQPKLDRIQEPISAVINFHPSGKFLSWFHVFEGKLLFSIYDLETKEIIEKELPQMDKVNSADYHPDGKTFVLSGVKNGQTDLFLYKVSGNSIEELTEDGFDDQDACFDPTGELVYFSSNRISDTLLKDKTVEFKQGSFDVFALKLKDKNKSKPILERLTMTDNRSEKNIQVLNSREFVYLENSSGTNQVYSLKIDSIIAFIDTAIHYRYFNKVEPITNFTKSIEEIKLNTNKSVIEAKLMGNQYIEIPITSREQEVHETYFSKNNLEEAVRKSSSYEESIDSTSVLRRQFSTDSSYVKEVLILFEDVLTEDYAIQMNKSSQKKFSYEAARAERYKINFAKDQISAKIDNSFLNQTYQSFDPNSPGFRNPTISGLIGVQFSDVMENYVLKSAIRIPTSRRASEFLLGIDFLPKRWDKSISYYRRSYENSSQKGLDLLITHEVATQLTYPINEVLSWRSSVSVREDVIHPLATDKVTITREIEKTFFMGAKSALVFDNSRWKNVNSWAGFRTKVFIDILQTSKSKSFGMMNLGFDARHSVELFKEMIWVNRIASGASYGGERLLYYMGGVDNWFLPPKNSYNSSITIDPRENFAFQT
ncbi:MAG: hypothetical protein KJ941_05120, partial [Bacteroidetes bacterium]|nr:hypothetical protein [Bacteroidota bacterium]